MSGAGAPGDATRRSATGLPRMQTASIAVVATVVALVGALGVSVAASRTAAPRSPDLAAVAAADGAPSVTDPGAAATASHDRAAAGPRGSASARPAGPATPEGGEPTAEPTQRPAGGAGEPGGTVATAPPPAAPVGASGSGNGSRTASTTLQLRAAGIGSWIFDARIVERTGLLAPSEQQVDVRTSVSDETDGVQRHEVEEGSVAVVGETVRHDEPGRRTSVLDLATGGAEPVRFSSDEGLLLVPRVVWAGMQWEQAVASDDRRTALDMTTTVVGLRRASVGAGADAREVEVVDIEQTLRLGGDHSMTITRRMSYAPELGLPVALDEEVKGTNAAGATLDRSVHLELRAAEPAADPAARTEP